MHILHIHIIILINSCYNLKFEDFWIDLLCTKSHLKFQFIQKMC